MVKRKSHSRLQGFILNKHVPLLVFLPLFTMLIGFLVSLLVTSEYQACATVMLIHKQEEKTDIYNNLLATREIAKTCAAIARTDKVALNILQQYNNRFTLKEIKEKIHVRLLPETALLQVSARDSDRDTAAKLANTAAAAIIAEFKNVLSLSDARIVSQAFPPDKPVPYKIINTAVGGMVGIVLTFAVILILDFCKKVN